MNKAQAATFLKVSSRTLQRLSQQGKISVAYKNSKTGAEADYDEDELRRHLEQQSSTIYRPATAIQESQALATLPNTNIINGADRLAAALEALQPAKKGSVPIESKPLLKLDEASALTGLSRQALRTAIDDKKLKAQISGRAWRIKRTELDLFIGKNF
jgi:excisionase family DNA binding protein